MVHGRQIRHLLMKVFPSFLVTVFVGSLSRPGGALPGSPQTATTAPLLAVTCLMVPGVSLRDSQTNLTVSQVTDLVPSPVVAQPPRLIAKPPTRNGISIEFLESIYCPLVALLYC